MSRVKWRIIRFWTDESRLPKPGAYQEPVGAWNRFKRHFMRKWTKEIKIQTSYAGAEELEPMDVGAVESGKSNASVEVTRATVPQGTVAVIGEDRVVATSVRNQRNETRHHQRQFNPEVGKETEIFQEDFGTGRAVHLRMDMGVGGQKDEGHSEVMVEERREGPDVSEEEANIISQNMDMDMH